MTAEQYGLTATIPARSIFTIDAAEKAGADYVIALSHVGYDDISKKYRVSIT